MYQEFSIISIDTVIQKKQITIEANKAINNMNDEDIIIQVYERETKTPMLFDHSIDFDKLIITLKEWPIPNTDYIIGVTGITSVTGDELDSNIKKRVRFDSKVLSKVKIASPAMFEEAKALNVKLTEVYERPEDIINKFYIEVSSDNAFFDVTNRTTIDKDTVTLSLKQNGQYYIRARVQSDDTNFSVWSSTISFIYGSKENSNVPPVVDNDDNIDIDVDLGEDDLEPAIDISEPFIITDYPDQGVTPEEGLLIAFSNLIDDMSLDNIIITRKEVR